jgi:TolB-like protein
LHAARRAGRVCCRRVVRAILLLLLAALWPGAVPARAAAPADPGAGAGSEKPTLAVLRFRVHSSKPLDYLGESLANLVRTRLEASGEVRVLPASATPDARAEAAEAQASDAALRSLAAEVGAAYVVSGSVTELAGRYSLDVHVTPAAVALRGHTLVLTAERDEELLARVNEVADGVLADVVDSAPAIVAKVELIGAATDAKALQAGLATRRGAAVRSGERARRLAKLRQDASIGSVSADTSGARWHRRPLQDRARSG